MSMINEALRMGRPFGLAALGKLKPLTWITVSEPQPPYGIGSVMDGLITGKVRSIRGKSVMLDRDLAELYGVKIDRLKEHVRRNRERFPEAFMFELTSEEEENSRSQNVILKQGENIKYLPFAFTEHGILMLANVLRSPRAVAVSIRIIDLFVRMRDALVSHHDILLRLEQLERRASGKGTDIEVIFHQLRQLLAPPVEPRTHIGFGSDEE